MRTILVDDEPWAIRSFQKYCENLNCINIIGTFTNPLEALEYAKSNGIDFAVLDIDMPQMNGLDLGSELRKLYPDIVIVYVTAYEQYANEALKQKADYYLTKPYSEKDILDLVYRARLLAQRLRKPVFIRTFGSFDVFVNGRIIEFSSAKAKELLALLVNNKGGSVSTEEAMAIIWENGGDSALCRTAAMRLRNTLASYGIEDILSEKGSEHYVNIDKFDCDYYMFLNGIKAAQWAFTDEYMTQYSWAEVTLSALMNKNNKLTHVTDKDES